MAKLITLSALAAFNLLVGALLVASVASLGWLLVISGILLEVMVYGMVLSDAKADVEGG